MKFTIYKEDIIEACKKYVNDKVGYSYEAFIDNVNTTIAEDEEFTFNIVEKEKK
jgi:hypothetical protein